MKITSFTIRGFWLLIVLSLTASVLAEFSWTELPAEMTIGQTYELAWTGAVDAVEIYCKKDASSSSWRAHVYGGGQYFYLDGEHC